MKNKILALLVILQITCFHVVDALDESKRKNRKDPRAHLSSVDESLFQTLLGEIKQPFKAELPVKVKDEQPEPVQPVVRPPRQEQPVVNVTRPVIEPRPARIVEPSRPVVQVAPVMPPVKEVRPEWEIRGIIWNTDLPQAIVNNRVVGVGDVVDNFKILEISKTGIAAEMNDKTYFVIFND